MSKKLRGLGSVASLQSYDDLKMAGSSMNVDYEAASALTAISTSPVRATTKSSSTGLSTPMQSPDAFSPFRKSVSVRRYVDLDSTPVPVDRVIFNTPMETPMLAYMPLVDGGESKNAAGALLALQQKKPALNQRIDMEAEDDRTIPRPPPPVPKPPPTVSEMRENMSQISQRMPSPLQRLPSPLHNGTMSTPRQSAQPQQQQQPLNPKTPQSQISKRTVLNRAAQSSSQEEDDDDDEATEEGSNLPKPCKCKKSRCLKLYCDCFNASRHCGKLCTCEDCYNTNRPEHQEHRKEAISLVLVRNPNAFNSKIMATPDSAQHATGCKCKRSGCLKKYCECFALGVRCAEHCKCSGCENYSGSSKLDDKSVSPAAAVASTTAAPLPPTSSTRKRQSTVLDEVPSPRKSARHRSVRESGDNAKNLAMGPRGQSVTFAPSGFNDGVSVHALDFSEGNFYTNENSMEPMLQSSQESKGSLASNTGEKLIPWGNDTKLPESLTRRLIDFLDEPDIVHLAMTSKRLAEAVISDEIWEYQSQPGL